MSEVPTHNHEPTPCALRAELFVADVPRSVAFYCEVLGFETIRESPGGYTSIGRQGAVLGLSEIARLPEGHPIRPRAGEPVGRGVELVVVVEDIAALHARACASRLATVSELMAQPWGMIDFRVVDPDGYYIRITN